MRQIDVFLSPDHPDTLIVELPPLCPDGFAMELHFTNVGVAAAAVWLTERGEFVSWQQVGST